MKSRERRCPVKKLEKKEGTRRSEITSILMVKRGEGILRREGVRLQGKTGCTNQEKQQKKGGEEEVKRFLRGNYQVRPSHEHAQHNKGDQVVKGTERTCERKKRNLPNRRQ